MDESLRRTWWVWVGAAGLLVAVLTQPDSRSFAQAVVNAVAVAVCPLAARADALHRPARTRWGARLRTALTTKPWRWAAVAAYATVAVGYSAARYDRPGIAIAAGLTGLVAAAVATRPMEHARPLAAA